MRTRTTFVAFLFLSVAVFAQEGVRKLDGAGEHTKYLTPGQLDEWIFEGEKGETVIVHVATGEFDSVLGLAVKREKQDQVLFEVDDDGSDSRFALRLPEKVEYKIRVHAFKYNGGGNYKLHVRV